MAEEKTQTDLNNNSKQVVFPFPGKTSSNVWNHFGFHKLNIEGPATRDNLDMAKVVCKLCGKGYANKGNTTNLQAHLDANHRQSIGMKKNLGMQKQPTISFQRQIPKLSTEKRDKTDDTLLKLLVRKALPLSLTENHFFKEFVQELNPGFTVPEKKAEMRALEKKNEEMHNRVLTDLKNAQGVSLTHDGSTSMNTESFDTVTAHLITDDWELKNMVLQTIKIEGQHTGENISKNLLETSSAWGITEVTSITTDNAANEQKAVKLLGWNRFGCHGHRINLVVKKSLNIPEVSSLMKKGRRLVAFLTSHHQ